MRSIGPLLFLAACSGDPSDKPTTDTVPGGGDSAASEGTGGDAGGGVEGGGVEGGDDSRADSPTESTAPPDSTPPDSPTDSAPDSAPPEPENTIRFVALGDAGEGNDTQYQVADAMEAVCAVVGCDFALYLGDNFYESGVESADDELFETAFELPYAYLDFPFYVSLGNHDYGGNGAGYEYWKADYQLEYALTSDKFILPDNYYTFEEGPADFFALDTNLIFWGFGADEQTWLDEATAAADGPWKIAFGHHPYISNGSHGNAGNYEGLSWLPIVNGEAIKEFDEASICDQVDVYICGHDHDRQWLEATCGTEFLISGAGAKTTDMEHREDNPYWWEANTPGFLWVEVTETTFTGVFYDADGVEEYRRTITLD